jgi:predicted RecA/RadA family phage recombinase
MTRKVVHTGGEDDIFQYTNGGGATILAGTLIKMMHTLGVALVDIAVGATGSVAVGGIISGVPKVPAAVFAVGEKLIWDVSAASGAGEFDDSAATPATGDVTGAAVAAVAGANAETTCTIKLTPGNATIT